MKYDASFDKAVEEFEAFSTCGLFTKQELMVMEYFIKAIFDTDVEEYSIVEERIKKFYKNAR